MASVQILILNGAIHWINIAPQTVHTFNFKCIIYIWHSIICKNIFFLVGDISFSALNYINLFNVSFFFLLQAKPKPENVVMDF